MLRGCMHSNLFTVHGCSDGTADVIKLTARDGVMPLVHRKSYVCNKDKAIPE